MSVSVKIFKNKQELLEAAITQADKSSLTEFSESIKLYFIARYWVAVFESRNAVIPIQVWNEYRNALDHYMRYLTQSNNDDKNSQLKAMRGHLQRAALDVIKIICHTTEDHFSKMIDSPQSQLYCLIDNGIFFQNIIATHELAKNKFMAAKIADHQLGENAKTNDDVLNHYLDAIYAFESLRDDFYNKRAAIAINGFNYTWLAVKNFWRQLGYKTLARLFLVLVAYFFGKHDVFEQITSFFN